VKICCFGSLNIDYVYSVEHFVRAGETISTKDRFIVCGGKGLNQSIAMSKAGASVYHAGNVSAMDGQLLLSTLQANGVDVSFVDKKNTANGHAIIQVDAKGENSILLFAGTNKLVSEEQIETVLSSFEPGDLLVLQNEINMLPQLVYQGHKKGLKVILNPSPVSGITETVPLSLIDILFANEKEACYIGGGTTISESVHHLRTRYPQMTVVCTMGKNGALVFDKEEYFFPAYHVKPIDTTGAGDTFLGFYVGSMTKRMNIRECLKYATAAAALSIQKKGASASIPTLVEVENFILKNHQLHHDVVQDIYT